MTIMEDKRVLTIASHVCMGVLSFSLFFLSSSIGSLLLGADGGFCFCPVLFRLFLGELVDEHHYHHHHNHHRRDG